MAQVTNVKTVKTKEQNGVLVEYLVENYGQSADFFVPDGAILDGQIDSRRVRSGMPVEYMSKDGKDFDWGQYSEDVEIQKRIANAFVYSFATFRKQGRGLYIYSSTKGSGKTLLACCLANEVLKKQDVSIKFAKESIFLMRTSGGFLTLHRAQLFRPEIRSWRFLVTRQEETTWRCRKIC